MTQKLESQKLVSLQRFLKDEVSGAEALPVRKWDTIDEPWFVACDVAQVLGIRNSTGMTSELDDDQKGVHTVRTRGGPRKLRTINW